MRLTLQASLVVGAADRAVFCFTNFAHYMFTKELAKGDEQHGSLQWQHSPKLFPLLVNLLLTKERQEFMDFENKIAIKVKQAQQRFDLCNVLIMRRCNTPKHVVDA